MARTAKFTRDDILDAAAAAVVEHGRDATIAQVATRAGAPTGSIYHRFHSREELFVSLWLRSIRHFHAGFLQAVDDPDPNAAAIACAVHIPRFCREHPAEGLAMTLYRQPDLVASGPTALAEEVAHVNDGVYHALQELAHRRYPAGTDLHLHLMATACQESPYGLIRRYLKSGISVPIWMDDVVRASTAAILTLGDSPATLDE